MKTTIAALACTIGFVTAGAAGAQSQPPAGPRVYAVEIKVGPAWDSSKKPHEQSHFREHSANLKRLRDQGSLVLGARYSDKGLVILQAMSEQEAHAMMQQDPSVQGKVFVYEVHEFNVFYSGSVQTRPARQ
jgi:uncharacterized protein YciI